MDSCLLLFSQGREIKWKGEREITAYFLHRVAIILVMLVRGQQHVIRSGGGSPGYGTSGRDFGAKFKIRKTFWPSAER
jgi:hypothetical protein